MTIGKEVKETLGNIPIPKGVKVVEVAIEGGNKLRFPTFETAKFGEITKAMESRALQTLDGVKKAISLPAWEKLSIRLEADGTPHLINNHKIDGKGYLQSLKDGGAKDPFPAWMSEKQIMKTVKEAYSNSKKLGIQNFKTGRILTLEGNANGMRIRIHLNLDLKQIESAYPVKGGVK
jgi:hypothetical protein